MKKYLLILLVLPIVSCSNKGKEYFDEIARTGGLFRGIEIKDGHDKIVEIEKDDFLIADEGVYLRYEYPINVNSIEQGEYKVEYYFDGEDQLHEMIFEIILEDKEATKELYNKFQSHFAKNFGKGVKNKEGYLIWRGKTSNTGLLEIALLDDSKFVEGKGYITLQINDFDY